MRRLLTAVAATAVVVGGLAVGAAPTAAADTSTHLPLTSYADMLVDEAHGHVFFTPGKTGSTVVVTDLTGANPTSLSGLSGATGLAMSADGSTVYVADYAANAITAIDAATLAVRTLAAGSDVDCVRYLAVAGGKLWYSHGCTAGSATVGTVDPGTGATTPAALTGGQTWYDPPYLAAGAPSSTVIGTADLDTSPVPVRTYDVSSGSGVLLASSPADACDAFYAMALSPSGADVALACDPPYDIGMFRTDTFAQENSYGGDSPYPSGVAMSAGGGFVAGGFSQHDPNVEVFPVGQPTAPTATYRLDAGGQGFLVHDGLRFGPSGDLYAVVPTSVYNNDFDLMVLHGSTLFPATISMTAPSTSARAHLLTVTGRLSSSTPPAGGQTVQVSRHDLAGTFALPPVTTNPDGSFGFSDTPAVGGPVTYTASWAGDATHRPATGSATVQVSRVATTVTVATKATRYAYHARAYITAHLGATYNSRRLAIYATPYRGARKLVRTGAVNTHGNLFASYVVTRRTTFTVVFPGDYRVAPASASRTVLVHARISEQLQDWYATSHGYRLYHRSSNPTLAAQLFPLQWSVCVYFRAQRLYGGAWHTTATSPCFRTDTAGQVAAVLIRNHVVGEPYRLRAEWRGNTTSLSQLGAWVYLKFTR